MKKTLELAKRCTSEKGKPRPKVGALVARGDIVLAEGFRGETEEGAHAEFVVLAVKAPKANFVGATLYTTLEPCTNRTPPKIPCFQRILDAGIKHVVIGMVDPNETIRGNGIWALRQKRVQVEFFDADLMDELEVLNAEFIGPHLAANTLIYSPHFLKPTQRRLDDWYYTINSVYLDKNFHRSAESIFSHLVEVMGGLSLLATDKKKPGIVPERFVTKALAWWLALCGKVGIRSVEDMLWSKYPGVCPYCLANPHKPSECKQYKKRSKDPDWVQLVKLGASKERPASLSDWQRMYNNLYPASDTDSYESIFGRFTEELGELAEAVRVVEVAPGYFISEAADVFAWLMKVTNFINYKRTDSDQKPLILDEELFTVYPDRCAECKRRICACPPILPTTLGRLAHEGPEMTSFDQPVFVTSRDLLSRFEVGSNIIQLGPKEVKIDSRVIADVYQVASYLIQRLRLSTDKMPDLLGVLQNVAGLAAVQRVSQTAIDDLVRMILWLQSNDREQLLLLLKQFPNCEWRDSLVEYIALRTSERDPS